MQLNELFAYFRNKPSNPGASNVSEGDQLLKDIFILKKYAEDESIKNINKNGSDIKKICDDFFKNNMHDLDLFHKECVDEIVDIDKLKNALKKYVDEKSEEINSKMNHSNLSVEDKIKYTGYLINILYYCDTDDPTLWAIPRYNYDYITSAEKAIIKELMKNPAQHLADYKDYLTKEFSEFKRKVQDYFERDI